MNSQRLPTPSHYHRDSVMSMAHYPSSSYSVTAKSPLSFSFTVQSPPMSPRIQRLRALSIGSVSSTTSEAIASRIQQLSLNKEDSAMIVDPTPDVHSNTLQHGAHVMHLEEKSQDHTGEPGFEEMAGEVDVYLAAEPNTDGRRSEELLWVLFWRVGPTATGVCIVRRAAGVLCEANFDGEALINVMGTNEVVAGLQDVKPMHMCNSSIGKLSFEQRCALRDVADRTPGRELSKSDVRVSSRLLNHKEWMEAVLQDAIEENILSYEKVLAGFSEILHYND